MWLYRTNGRDAKREPDAEAPESGLRLERYRAYGDFYERYWSRMFGVTQSDHDRLAQRIRETGAALDLTTVVQDIVLNRLQQGPQLNSRPAPNGRMPLHIARAWDSTAIWHVGDRAIVVVPNPKPGHPYVARIGELLTVADDHVVMKVDSLSAPQVYPLGIGRGLSNEALSVTARVAPEVAMASLREAPDEEAQVDYCLWKYGGHVATRVLHALEADERFVELEGRWFLTDLAQRPNEGDLVALARAMFAGLDVPVTPAELARELPRFAPADVAATYGLLLAMLERPDLFANAGSPSHPRWTLAGPPPMRFFVEHAVYDPDTYEVLCVPGEMLSLAIARRLWDIGLLREALAGGTAPERDADDVRPSFEERLSQAVETPPLGGHSAARGNGRHRRSGRLPLGRR